MIFGRDFELLEQLMQNNSRKKITPVKKRGLFVVNPNDVIRIPDLIQGTTDPSSDAATLIGILNVYTFEQAHVSLGIFPWIMVDNDIELHDEYDINTLNTFGGNNELPIAALTFSFTAGTINVVIEVEGYKIEVV